MNSSKNIKKEKKTTNGRSSQQTQKCPAEKVSSSSMLPTRSLWFGTRKLWEFASLMVYFWAPRATSPNLLFLFLNRKIESHECFLRPTKKHPMKKKDVHLSCPKTKQKCSTQTKTNFKEAMHMILWPGAKTCKEHKRQTQLADSKPAEQKKPSKSNPKHCKNSLETAS